MRNTKTDRLTESTSIGEITSLSPWQRIEAIIRHYRFPSISAFARELGLRRAENLFQIKKGNNRLSIGLADTISVKYPQLNKIWILTG